MDDIIPDAEAIRAWLATLYAGCPPDEWLCAFGIDRQTGRQRILWGKVADTDTFASRLAAAALDCDVWLGVATRAERLDRGRGGRDDCLRIPGLWVDIDIAGPGHKTDAELPRDENEAMDLLTAIVNAVELGPTDIVRTGGGIQAWWRFKAPELVDDTLLARWGATLLRVADEQGYHLDSVWDAPRVLRIPGTVNRKTDTPRPVTLHSSSTVPADRIEPWQLALDEPKPPPAPKPVDIAPAPLRAQLDGAGAGGSDTERPGDWYNAHRTGHDILRGAGWVEHHRDHYGHIHYTRPGKVGTRDDSPGATVYADNGRTTIFTSDPEGGGPGTFDPFGLFAHIYHRDDLSEAARTVRAIMPTRAPTPRGASDDGAGQEGGPQGEGEPDWLIVNGRRDADVVNDVIEGLAQRPESGLYRYNGVAHRLSNGDPLPLNADGVITLASFYLNVARIKDGKITPCTLPRSIAIQVCEAIRQQVTVVPEIKGFASLPIVRPDGTIHLDVGLDPITGIYRRPGVDVTIPDDPTPADVQAALDILNDILADFLFADDLDRIAALGALLTIVIRHDGPLPVLLIQAKIPGTGKTYLAEIIQAIAVGRSNVSSWPKDEEELRKRVTSHLMAGDPVVVFDNLDRKMRTGVWAGALTANVWSDRVMRENRIANCPNRSMWIATGNNIALGGDIGRRFWTIDMDTNLAHPERRTGLRHPNLLAHVIQNRGRIVSALLTLVQAWRRAGSPATTIPFGNFTDWATAVGGILDHAGEHGFLARRDEQRAEMDTDEQEWETFLMALWERFGGKTPTSAEIADRCEIDSELRHTLPGLLPEHWGRPGFTKLVGEALRMHRQRPFGELGWVVEPAGKNRLKQQRWKITRRVIPITNAEAPRLPPSAATEGAGTAEAADADSDSQQDSGPAKASTEELW